MRRGLLAVAALVVLAGCGSVFVGDERTRSGDADGTLTPAPVPEVTPTPERWGIAPGLTGAGVVDMDALVAAHREAVANRSYVWRESRGATTGFGRSLANASVPMAVWTVARVESESVYSLRKSREHIYLGRGVTYATDYREYADGSVRYIRYDDPRERSDQTRAVALVPAKWNHNVGGRRTTAIRQYLAAENATVARTRIDGRPGYVVVAHRADLSGVLDLRSYTARALVTPAGLVRSLNVTYVAVTDGVERRVRYTFAYDRLDATAVDPPEWAAVDE